MLTTHDTLVHAVTEYDRKQSTRKGYNMWALPQYLRAIDNVEREIADGMELRPAITHNFCGRLLDVVLKSVGLSQSTDAEQRF